MPRIEHILFPHDFSRPCTLVAPQVRAVACRFGAKVTLLTVYPTSWDRHSPEMPILKGLDAPEEELKALLGPVAANMFAGIPVEIKTAMGDAAFKIVQFARPPRGFDYDAHPRIRNRPHVAYRFGYRQGPARIELPGVDRGSFRGTVIAGSAQEYLVRHRPIRRNFARIEMGW